MDNLSIKALIGQRVLAVLGAYNHNTPSQMDVYICGISPISDNQLHVFLPKGHQLELGQAVTLHLDNRTGIAEYDAELHVNRVSYKAKVTKIDDFHVVIDALEYQVFYGLSPIKEYRASGYAFPLDERPLMPLAETPLLEMPSIDMEEHDNKIGVLLTYAPQQPHTTVMAFLSSSEDDIFFITFPSTFKGQLLSKDNRCYFAIDNRATYTFEQAVEWNYSIIQGQVYEVPKTSALFKQIQVHFVEKNPWEMAFFTHPEIQMYHLKPEHVVCPTHGL